MGIFKNYWLWFLAFVGLLLILALMARDFYLFIKLLVWFGVAFSVSLVGRELVLVFLVVAALVNGLMGIGQVIKQHDLGFYVLGESRLEIADKKVSLAYLGGNNFILRAYGLTPHPNVLGGLIFLGIIATLYFLIKRRLDSIFPSFAQGFGMAQYWNDRWSWLLWVVWAILWVSLILTFSRSAWLATVVGLGFIYFNFERFGLEEVKKYFKKIFLATTTFILVFVGWAVVPRVKTWGLNNFTVMERMSGFEVFTSNIYNYGFFGEGLSLKIQEPLFHSLYLMMFKEGGLVFLLVFLALVYSLFRDRFDKLTTSSLKSSDWRLLVPLAMLLGLLIIGLFDHYLWTIRQGVGMLLLSLGLLI